MPLLVSGTPRLAEQAGEYIRHLLHRYVPSNHRMHAIHGACPCGVGFQHVVCMKMVSAVLTPADWCYWCPRLSTHPFKAKHRLRLTDFK